jgi:hypothetical protein
MPGPAAAGPSPVTPSTGRPRTAGAIDDVPRRRCGIALCRALGCIGGGCCQLGAGSCWNAAPERRRNHRRDHCRITTARITNRTADGTTRRNHRHPCALAARMETQHSHHEPNQPDTKMNPNASASPVSPRFALGMHLHRVIYRKSTDPHPLPQATRPALGAPTVPSTTHSDGAQTAPGRHGRGDAGGTAGRRRGSGSSEKRLGCPQLVRVNVGTTRDRANVIHRNSQAFTGSYPQRWTTVGPVTHRCG